MLLVFLLHFARNGLGGDRDTLEQLNHFGCLILRLLCPRGWLGRRGGNNRGLQHGHLASLIAEFEILDRLQVLGRLRAVGGCNGLTVRRNRRSSFGTGLLRPAQTRPSPGTASGTVTITRRSHFGATGRSGGSRRHRASALLAESGRAKRQGKNQLFHSEISLSRHIDC